jgi:pimeloyl-ACP methyl ester carboxylesterase
VVATFCLVHGAWHGAWVWELVAPELEAYGHRVVLPELPCDDVEATFDTYADAVTDALGDVKAPIVVGHSLAGMTIPRVAERYSDSVLVFLCAFLRIDGRAGPPVLREEFGADLRDELGRSEWSRERALDGLYAHVARPVAEPACERLRPQAQTPFAHSTPLVALPDRPSAWILALDDEAFTPAWSRWAARQLVGVEPIELPGGHFPMYERPLELVELLLEHAA